MYYAKIGLLFHFLGRICYTMGFEFIPIFLAQMETASFLFSSLRETKQTKIKRYSGQLELAPENYFTNFGSASIMVPQLMHVLNSSEL